jgi:hypothetical protein
VAARTTPPEPAPVAVKPGAASEAGQSRHNARRLITTFVLCAIIVGAAAIAIALLAGSHTLDNLLDKVSGA